MDLNEFLRQARESIVVDWIFAIALVIIGIVLAAWLAKRIRSFGRNYTADDGQQANAVAIVSRIVQSLVVIVVVATALRMVGIDLGPVLASAGVVGIVVGFALKDIAENYIAGTILAFRRAFVIGDEIIVADQIAGRVEELSLRYVRLRTRDGLRVYVPNSTMLTESFVNLTRNGSRRGEFVVGVSYDADLNHARQIATDAVNSVNDLKDPSAEAWVNEFQSSSVELLVWFWYDPNLSNKGVRSKAMIAVKEAFDREGIEMPQESIQITSQRPNPFRADPAD